MENEEFISRLRDEYVIKNVVLDYCRGVDRLDLELVRNCYHPDAIDEHGSYNGDVQGLIAWMKQRHKMVDQSMHFVGNMKFDWVSRQKVIVETYCVTYQRLSEDTLSGTNSLGLNKPPKSRQTEVRCRYIDFFENRDEEWKIAKRSVVYDSIAYEESTEKDDFGKHFRMSERGASDVLYGYLNLEL